MSERPARPPASGATYATLVVSDLKGSTALGERLDAEALRAVMTRYIDTMRRVLEHHDGRVAKIIGDAIVTVFVAEDPAVAALRAVTAGGGGRGGPPRPHPPP